jgi:hypothetical protein
MRDSNVVNTAKESAQIEFLHGLLDFCTTAWNQERARQTAEPVII